MEDVTEVCASVEEGEEGSADEVAFLLREAGCVGMLEEGHDGFWWGRGVNGGGVVEEVGEGGKVGLEEAGGFLG